MADHPASDTVPPLKRPGERLRDAREAEGLSLADIAARTRVPTRHLEAIEAGDFSLLPSVTYAMGFSKAYARAVGLDEVALARDVRAELDRNWDRPVHVPSYTAEDPARGPSRTMVWGGLLVGLVVIVVAALWFSGMRMGDGTPTTAAAPPSAAVAPTSNGGIAVPPPGGSVQERPVAAGQVTLMATDAVWVRVYDGDQTLFMKEMTPGERYDVPPDARDPMINIGRPDKLDISVNGSRVAALGDGRRAIKDVRISAPALLGRDAPTPGPSPSGAASQPTGE